ncbi:MAG: cupin domain-containing protein [Nanoarchaeota archaeon]
MDKVKKGNIFSKEPSDKSKEIFETIIQSKNCKIERIISHGQETTKGKWYNQEENEFVIVLKGNAKILFENKETIALKEGDYIDIPKNIKHRVEETSDKEGTIWLAVFYK